MEFNHDFVLPSVFQFDDNDCKTKEIQIKPQVTQAHCERSAYNNLFIFAYFISRQNIRVCMENETKTL